MCVGWLIFLARPEYLAILPNKEMVATSHAAQKRVAVPKSLVQPTRLLLTARLMQGELCVGELRELVGADVSTVSKQRLFLRQAGVAACQNWGLNVYDRLACDCFSDLLECLNQVCPTPASAGGRAGGCC